MAHSHRFHLRSSFAVFVLAICLVCGSNAGRASAQSAPKKIPFQGFLTSSGGTPTNTTVSITFKLYKGTTAVWTEVQPSVTVTNGLFNVILGSVVSLDTVQFNRPIDLSIKVGADPEIVPRTSLGASAFALGMPGMYATYVDNGFVQSVNVVGGGANNKITPGAAGATIGGGGGVESPFNQANSVAGDFGTVGGGAANKVLGYYSTVSGGRRNVAVGSHATVSGGFTNAAGEGGTVPGGFFNRAMGEASFAAGHGAKAAHDGSFVWNDRAGIFGDDTVRTTGPNQFIIAAAGGVGIGTNAPGAPLDVAGGLWDFSVSEGDVRIGTPTQRLKIGVATAGGGAGIVRLNAVGTVSQLVLGAANADVAFVSTTAFAPWISGGPSLGTSSQKWSVVYALNGTIQTSDRRLKDDIRSLPYGLRSIMNLDPIVFRWIDRPEEGDKLGLIAQDVEEIIPEVVHHGASEDEVLGISYADLVPVLIKAMQELQGIVETQGRILEEQGRLLEGLLNN